MAQAPAGGGGDPSLVFDSRVHQALASPVRSRIMALLRAVDDGLDVAGLADELDLHVNTVRTHLGLLEDVGLVVSAPQPRERAGRPRHVYRPTDRAAHVGGAAGYQFLSRMLVGHVATADEDPGRASEQTGSAWGRWLVDEPAPGTVVEPRVGIDQVVQLLDRFGFEPELDDTNPARPRLLLRRCPFLDLARDHPEVVCALHLGLMRGALDVLDVDVVVEDLQPFVEPSLCVSNLQVPGPQPARRGGRP